MSTKRPVLRTASWLALLAMAAAMPRARATEISSAGNGNWTNTATWSPGTIPGANDNVTILTNHTVTISDLAAHAVSNLTVNGGGAITHSANNTSETCKVVLNVGGDLVIATSGLIDVTGKGYADAKGPAPGNYSNIYGGGYGGLGGGNAAIYTLTYGCITAPTNCGSGGGSNGGNVQGGGAAILCVTGNTTVNGVIRADGQQGVAAACGAAGGSVWLTTATLTGSGTISAKGSECVTSIRSSGGGGRIAVQLTSGTSFDNVSMLAYGTSNTTSSGAAGTVYMETASQGTGNGTLIIDDGGYTAAAGDVTLISTNVTGTAVGTVMIRNQGQFVLNNGSFTVRSGFSNLCQSVNVGAAGSTMVVDGSNTCSFGGLNTAFYNLSCTNAGKTILFATNTTFTVNGILTLVGGGVGSEITVDGASGSQWYLNASPFPSQHLVRYVKARYSNAGPGAMIQAYSSVDLGNNSNWAFAVSGETNAWTGLSNTTWGVSTNWSRNRPPVNDDSVLITNGCPRYPLLSTNVYVNILDIRAGGSLSLNRYNLTLTNLALIAGTLSATGTETVTIQKDVDFTGGTFNCATSTVLIAGVGAQSLTFDNTRFYQLTVQNPTPLTLTGPFSAINFLCGTKNALLTFQAGSTYSITNLYLFGTRGSLIQLRSTSPGTPWKLNVSGLGRVFCVDAQDSDASAPGLPIYAVSSTNSTGNVNWFFGDSTWVTWNGGVSTSFTNANNWIPAISPGITNRILFDGNCTNAPRITNSTVVTELAIGGYTSATLTVDAPLLVSGNLTILANGVLTHTANGASELYKLNVTVATNLVIDTGGAIDVTGKGYADGKGPAPGNYSNIYGGSHGGLGGNAASYSLTYGCITAPTNLGSGGGSNGGNIQGGGAAILCVTGNTTVNGAIRADGQQGVAAATGAGGGSVWLTTATLAGSGTISAKGSALVNSIRSSGGGGRIAVQLTSGASFDNVNMLAYGTSNSTSSGAAGTMYMETASQRTGNGTLIIDYGGYTTAAGIVTLISTNVTGTSVGAVMIRNKAQLVISSNATLVVTGSWTNDTTATFTANTNSTVSFTGTNEATVWGNNTFSKLSIGDPGTKPLSFQAGKTNTVRGDLAISQAVLGSTSTGQWWFLTVTNNATQSHVRWVTVRDSNATNGAQIVVTRGGTDLGHNVNWKFIPPPGTIISLR